MNSRPALAGSHGSGGRAFPALPAAALALMFPATVLLYERAGSAILHGLAALALLALAIRPLRRGGGPGLRPFLREYGAYCAAMLLPLVANVLSQVGSGRYDDAFSSNVQRLALAPLVLWLLLQVPPATLRKVQWGVAAGALAATVMLFAASIGGASRPDPSSLNLLNYTNILVLLGCFSLCSLGWRLTDRPKTEAAIKLVAVAASLYSVVLSQSKGPLLALGALLVLCLFWQLRSLSLRSRVLGAVLVLAGCFAVALHVDRFKEGVDVAMDIVESLAVGTPADAALNEHGDGSISVRLGLWQASWQMFLEHPWFGVGNKQFSEGLAQLNAQGHVPDWAVWRPDRTPFTQAHNEFFNAMASTGLVGVLALLALYGVPLAYFVRRCRRNADHQTRVAAFMGVLLCVGYALFGTTVSLFSSTIVSTFYSVMGAIFLALSRPEAADPAAARQPNFLGGWADGALRRIYKRTHARAYRHNRHLWPYVRCRRSPAGAITAISVAGVALPLIGVREAFAGLPREFHLVLSGPSVRDIDYRQLKLDAAMGVNGSIALQSEDPDASVGPRFSHYCIIDHTFVWHRPALVRRVLDSDLVLIVTPQVLRFIVERHADRPMRCRLCVIENIAERAGRPTPTPAALRAWQAEGRDIVVFDDRQCLGFSFDPDLGFFDADTVAYAALQVLVWGGVRRVVFHGLDIKGAAGGQRFYEHAHDRLDTRLERNFSRYIEPSFRQAAPVLKQRGVQLANLSPDSAIGPDIIARADWRSLIAAPAARDAGGAAGNGPARDAAGDGSPLAHRPDDRSA